MTLCATGATLLRSTYRILGTACTCTSLAHPHALASRKKRRSCSHSLQLLTTSVIAAMAETVVVVTGATGMQGGSPCKQQDLNVYLSVHSTSRCSSTASSLFMGMDVILQVLSVHLHFSGGGVVDHLLADNRTKYHVRGITRDVSSPKAKKLADRGVEVVQGDLEHKESLVKVRPACLRPAHSLQRPVLQGDVAVSPS